ncbi:hypothetical protein ACL6C3_15275 [Capilliphycus salinus ALCB114379]|uniref:hypothetical protein n=1 Tax=Capilliphycus salinus TaxID=2768948 RepID=UPI0039A45396
MPDENAQLPLAQWQTRQSFITSISLSEDGQFLTTLGKDGSEKTWAIQSSDELLMQQACSWVRDYLKYNSDLNNGDRRLCNGIKG